MVLRYQCRGAHRKYGGPRRITFSGLRVDRAVAGEVLRAISGYAVEAAEKMRQHFREQRRAVELELEQARYEAKLSARRYEAVDPDHRLVAAELEACWNAARRKAPALEERVGDFDDAGKVPAIPDKEILLSLAPDLPAVWNSPGTEAGLKQRIVRILVEELVVDVDAEKQEVVLLIHWAGGRHYSGNAQRVCGLRRQHELPNAVSQVENRMVTLQQAADRLGVSELSVKRMIEQKVLPATQAVPCAPWEISLDALNSPAVQQAIDSAHRRRRPPPAQDERSDPLFSES